MQPRANRETCRPLRPKGTYFIVSSEWKAVPPVLSAAGGAASQIPGAASAAPAADHIGTETNPDAPAQFVSGMSLHCAARHSGHCDFNFRPSISLLCVTGEADGRGVADPTMARFPSRGCRRRVLPGMGSAQMGVY